MKKLAKRCCFLCCWMVLHCHIHRYLLRSLNAVIRHTSKTSVGQSWQIGVTNADYTNDAIKSKWELWLFLSLSLSFFLFPSLSWILYENYFRDAVRMDVIYGMNMKCTQKWKIKLEKFSVLMHFGRCASQLCRVHWCFYFELVLFITLHLLWMDCIINTERIGKDYHTRIQFWPCQMSSFFCFCQRKL